VATPPTADAQRVLVVLAPGENEDGALSLGREIVEESGAELTVVSLASQDTRPARCVVGTTAYNQAARDGSLAGCDGRRTLTCDRSAAWRDPRARSARRA
jgi:hypothetical protein